MSKEADNKVEQIIQTVSNEYDDEQDAADRSQARDLTANWVEGSEEEKMLVRKLDWRILTGGLEEDFNLTSDQYSIIVLVFFILYLVCEVPADMILTRVKPHVFLPGLGVVWGTLAALMGATNNWHQLAGMRFLLGAAEAGFAPGCAFFLSSWYRRYELSTRFALLYTSVPIACAVSGPFAGVITQYIDGAAGLPGWRWLFILEGLASVVAAIFIFFLLPDYPSNSGKFLNEQEQMLACNRLAVDGIALTQGAGVKPMPHWTAFKLCVSDWRVCCQCILFVLVTGSQTMQYFIPTLVAAFGRKGYIGQYHTIPAYAAVLVYVVACSWLADRYRTKGPFVTGLSALGCILFIAVTTSETKMVQCVLVIFAFGAIYGCSPLIKTWVSDVIPQPAEKRAIAIALINSIGNASSIHSTWLWPMKDAPRYIPGFATTTTWLGVLSILAVIFAMLFKKYPVARMNHEETMANEIRAQREAEERRRTKV